MLILTESWIENANGLIALITAFCGLVATAISLFALIKKILKEKKNQEASATMEQIKAMALAAMAKAEESGKAGKEKKQIVIDSVTEALKSQGVNITPFLSQLDAFINQSIEFANQIKPKSDRK